MAYVKTVPAGEYHFGPDTFKTDDFTEFPDPSVNSEEFTTVATMDLRKGEGAALGRGNTSNPDEAEGFIFMDVLSASDSDSDGNNDPINGRAKIVVLNTNNTPVDTIWRGRLSELRDDGDPAVDGEKRRDRKPFPYQTPVEKATGEVYGEDYSIGLQIETDDGTATFSLAASRFRIEGYYGENMS